MTKSFNQHEIIWDDEKVARLWNYYSKTYPYNEYYFTRIYGKYILQKSKKYVGINNKIIIDFGCGPGYLLEHLRKCNFTPQKYIGLDFSENSVSLVTSKTTNNFIVEVHKIDKLPTKLPDEIADVCFLIEVIEHLNDEYLCSTLLEIRRLLRTGGKLVITTPHNEDLRLGLNFCPECGAIYHRMQHVRSWSDMSMNDYLLRFGFKKIYCLKTTFLSSDFKRLCNLHQKLKNFLKNQKPNMLLIFEKGDC